MPVTEIQLVDLINRLVEVLGEERTETIMQCLILEGRDQLATKDDLKVLEASLRGELASSLAKQNRQHVFMFVSFIVTNWATMVPLALAT